MINQTCGLKVQRGNMACGPWREEREYVDGGVEIQTHDGYCIGIWNDNDWNGYSPNSQAIAAVPELIAALQIMLSQFKDNVQYAENEDDGDIVAVKQARAALVKAGVE
jgi:hypothetical protein